MAAPGLLFIAEAYWDMEWTLQQQGFDYCYDKRLYDRLVARGRRVVRGHLQADPATRSSCCASSRTTTSRARPPRSAPEQARAAAVVMSTFPGARLYHDGQLSGKRTNIPVFLGRGPAEPPDADLRAFYAWLLPPCAAELSGSWRLLDERCAARVLGLGRRRRASVETVERVRPAGGLEPWGYKLPFG